MSDNASGNQTLGYYEFGKWPTIVDPRTTGNPDPSLTLLHEQAHRDLFSNTLYGCAVNRLWGLSQLTEAADRDPGGRVKTLVHRAWQCIEGSATALEYSVMSTRGRTDTDAFTAELPDDYRKALRRFAPVLDLRLRGSSPVDRNLLKGCLISGIAETALDWVVFTNPPTKGFWPFVELLGRTRGPDEILTDLVQKVLGLSTRQHCAIIEAAQRRVGSEQILGLGRNAVSAYKEALLDKFAIAGPQRRLISDSERMKIVAAWVDELKAEFSAYRAPIMVEGIYGPEVNVAVREPAYLMSEEEIADGDLVQRVEELASVAEFEIFVFEFLWDNANNARILMAKPIHTVDDRRMLGEPYLICRDGSRSIEALEALAIPHVWLTRGLLVGDALEPYDRDFVCARRAPVFLELQPFNWCNARRLLEPYPGPVVGRGYTIHGYSQFEVAALTRGNATVFGIVTPRFPSASLFVQDVQWGEAELEDNPALSAVVVIVMGHSKEHALISQ